MNNLAPFTPLAQQYVGQLQGLLTLEGQGNVLKDYYNSDQNKQLADQASYQQLASAEAPTFSERVPPPMKVGGNFDGR